MDNESKTERQDAQPHPALPAPRFGLLSLLLLVAAAAAGLAAWMAAGPILGVAGILAILVVFAHVAGNALGSQLRDRSTQHSRGELRPREPVTSKDYAPVTHLSRRVPLGWFTLVGSTLGALVAAIGGAAALYYLYPDTATPASLLVGSLATGALGGFFSFWICSLLQVLMGAWWQAHVHEYRTRPKRRH